MKRTLLFVLLAGQCFAQTIAIKAGRLVDPDVGTVLSDQVILIKDNKIEAVGKGLAIPAGANVIDLSGKTVLPGLIDCHTHLVYAGDRSSEFERRLEGESYEDIARSGGGILSTVRATRDATQAQLRTQSARRLEAMMREGVTTVEIKSGYGLDLENEAK